MRDSGDPKGSQKTHGTIQTAVSLHCTTLVDGKGRRDGQEWPTLIIARACLCYAVVVVSRCGSVVLWPRNDGGCDEVAE
jgi:hypothetical protein